MKTDRLPRKGTPERELREEQWKQFPETAPTAAQQPAAHSPLVIDTDRIADINTQCEILRADIGTDREWIALGHNDEEGFAEVVALAHPINAPRIVRAVNNADKLAEALRGLLESYVEENGGDMPSNDSHPAFDAKAVLAAYENDNQ